MQVWNCKHVTGHYCPGRRDTDNDKSEDLPLYETRPREVCGIYQTQPSHYHCIISPELFRCEVHVRLSSDVSLKQSFRRIGPNIIFIYTMKKVKLFSAVTALLLASASFTGCETNTDDLWDSIGDINDRLDALEAKVDVANTDLSALKVLVESMQNQVTITSVDNNENGYTIHFSDGREVTISNGKNGTNAPQIAVVKGDDGKYYWTLDGEIIKVEGQPLSATGADGVTPRIRINPDSKMWEVSTDGGQTWESTGVVAEAGGSSIFASVSTDNPEYVIFTLSNGTVFSVSRYDADAAVFAVEGIAGTQTFTFGETRTFKVKAANISDFSITKPDGWRASYADGVLTLTAPDAANTYAEREGNISVNIVSAAGKAMIVKIAVAVFEMKVLTFEDADAKFSEYPLSYANANIAKWSDLIDSKQYGGILLYGEDTYGMDEPYYWYDEGNTELMHLFPESMGEYCYWYGGHAISNYTSTNLADGTFMNQLAVYGTSGNNGSKNFAVHNGYIDDAVVGMSSTLPALEFYDGQTHVIDHMYVNNTLYAVAEYRNNTSISDSDWAAIEAKGYDESGVETGTATFYLFKGVDNIVTEWTRWDLSVLGAVSKVEFNIKGSLKNTWGLTTPAYFAYDDVAVRL